MNTKEKRAIRIDKFDPNIKDTGVWVWNRREDRMSWTEGFNLLLGIECDTEPTFELLVKCIYPEDRKTVYDNLETVLDDWQAMWFTFRIIRPDQSVITLQCLVGCVPVGDTIDITGICAVVPNDESGKY